MPTPATGSEKRQMPVPDILVVVPIVKLMKTKHVLPIIWYRPDKVPFPIVGVPDSAVQVGV